MGTNFGKISELTIDVIIPAFNEEDAIAQVIDEIPKDIVREIVVVNNASKDKTKEVAQSAGATVIDEMNPGYGSACLKGIQYLKEKETPPDVVVFLDGDHSDYPHEMRNLIQPIKDNKADFVLGSRALGKKEKGAMTIPQVFGNALATFILRTFYRQKTTDLGPFRAIKYATLLSLNMVDRNYGWTVEMQIKAAQQNVRFLEIPVNYRNRIGQSKISGTVKGVLGAGYKILYTLFKYM